MACQACPFYKFKKLYELQKEIENNPSNLSFVKLYLQYCNKRWEIISKKFCPKCEKENNHGV
jgi:hypothetical protein